MRRVTLLYRRSSVAASGSLFMGRHDRRSPMSGAQSRGSSATKPPRSANVDRAIQSPRPRDSWHKRRTMSASLLFLGLVFSCIGFGFFLYGKNQRAPVPLVVGVILMIF